MLDGRVMAGEGNADVEAEFEADDERRRPCHGEGTLERV